MITFFQAIFLGLLQGVTELFPISSLGHTVLIPWLLGWNGVVHAQSQGESYYLSFVVMMHVATALALLVFYWKIWVRIIKGFFGTLKKRKIDTADGKLAWLLIVATIPAGLFGVALEHTLRTTFAKPLSAMIFLFINGLILLAGDRYQKQHGGNQKASAEISATSHNVSDKLTLKRAGIIGVAQIGALFAGISRSGITMVSGLMSGLNHEDAARFSFLLATPIILGAGLYKLPDFFSNLDAGVRSQILAGSIAAGIAAYLTVRFLDKYFQNKTLKPFAIYCICASLALFALGLVRGHF